MTTPNDRPLNHEADVLSAWLLDDHRRLERRPRNLESARTADQGTGAISGADASSLPDLGPLSKLESWASVASTILYKAQTLAGWDPTGTSFDDQTWTLYLSKVATVPFFLTTSTSSRDVDISPTSLKGVVGAIADRTRGIAAPSVAAAVLTSVKQVATVVVGNKGTQDKKSSVSQGLISVFESRLHVAYVSTTIPMIYKSAKKGYDPTGPRITIRGFTGTLDFDRCKRFSNTLLGWTADSAEQWTQRTSSAGQKPNSSPAWGE